MTTPAMTPQLMLMAFLSCVGVFAHGAQVKPINSTGVFFEFVDSVAFYHDVWSFITEVPLEPWEQHLTSLRKLEGMVLRLCTQVPASDLHCEQVKQEVDRALREIQVSARELEGLTAHRIRNKRAFFDGIGKLQKFLFGTLDNNDGNRIYSRLDSLQHDSESMYELLRHQITVFNSTFSSLHKPLNSLQQDQEALALRVEEIWNETRNALPLAEEMHSLLDLLTLRVNEVERKQNGVFDILMALNLHKLHPLMISADSLTQLYRNITRDTTRNPTFAQPHIILQVAQIDHIVLDGKIVIKVTIPLYDLDVYQLYKLYLLPQPIPNGRYAYFDLEYEYIAHVKERHTSLLLTKENLESCNKVTISLSVHLLSCKQTTPKISGVHSGQCALQLFYNPFQEEPLCPLRTTSRVPEVLAKLTKPNTYLFILRSIQTVTSRCPGQVHHAQINGTGILTLDRGCDLEMGPVLIPYEMREGPDQVGEIHSAVVTLNFTSFDEDQVRNWSEKGPVVLSHPEQLNGHLTKSAIALADLREHLQRVETDRQRRRQGDYYPEHLPLGLAVASLFGLVLLTVCVLLYKCQHRSAPSPTMSGNAGTELYETNFNCPSQTPPPLPKTIISTHHRAHLPSTLRSFRIKL